MGQEIATQSDMKMARPLFTRAFVMLWIGQAISVLGDFVFETACVLWVGAVLVPGRSWTPLAVSGVLFAAAIPSFLFGPIAGVFTDRWTKRRTILLMDGIRALLIGLLTLTTGVISFPFLPHGKLPVIWQLWILYIVVFLASVCTQFFSPARMTISQDIVDEVHRVRASGLAQTTTSLGAIVGSLLAAPLVFTAGVSWTLLIDALSFGISFLSIILARLPEEPSPQVTYNNFLNEFRAGAHFLITHRVLRTALIAMCIVLFSGGIDNTLSLFFATQNLHLTPALYGVLSSASGIGLLVGAAIIVIIGKKMNAATLFGVGILLLGTMEAIFSRQTNIVPALLILSIQGILNAALNVAFGPLVMNATPREFLGRVFAFLLPAMNLATMISTLITGYLVSTVFQGLHLVIVGMIVGPIDGLMMFSGLLIFFAGLYVLLQLRGI
ncbi:MAG TPA: MFS transporter [Ktedonobacter sp.]|nr:MFS transporter [Ktedonobacter sp.]